MDKRGMLPASEFVQSQKALLLSRYESIRSTGNMSKTLTDTLTRIEYALKRIENETYGVCCHCGDDIEKKRLAQIPETPFCVSCAEEREYQKNRNR